jgi:hypothetical protein
VHRDVCRDGVRDSRLWPYVVQVWAFTGTFTGTRGEFVLLPRLWGSQGGFFKRCASLLLLAARASLITSPIRQVGAHRVRTTLDDEPCGLGVAVIPHLMLCPGWDEDGVALGEVVALPFVLESLLYENHPRAMDEVHNGI